MTRSPKNRTAHAEAKTAMLLASLASINTGYTPRVQPLDAFTAF